MAKHSSDALLTNRAYDLLKLVALIFLPALAVLYGTLAGIWGFPRGQEVASTIVAIEVFLGVFLKWASDRYDKDGDGEYDKEYQGTFSVNTTEDGSAYRLLLDSDPEELEKMNSFSLKVVHE